MFKYTVHLEIDTHGIFFVYTGRERERERERKKKRERDREIPVNPYTDIAYQQQQQEQY